MKQRKPLKRNKPLTAKAPPKPKAPLKAESAKKKATKREYQKQVAIEGVYCFTCTNQATERHHIYTQAQAAYLVTEPLNLLPLCHSCHAAITGREKQFREELRVRMPERMAVLDVMYETLGKANRNRKLSA